MDSVQKVGNGHPGTAMSLAPAAYVLFQKMMRHDPADADWTGRDRFDLHIFAIAGDGCLQEGISAEASSMAGHQKLGNLILLWDDNHISIEGDTETAISEDTCKRYEAYGWHVQRVAAKENGDLDPEALFRALEAAKAETERPSFIAFRSIIAWPAPNAQNT